MTQQTPNQQTPTPTIESIFCQQCGNKFDAWSTSRRRYCPPCVNDRVSHSPGPPLGSKNALRKLLTKGEEAELATILSTVPQPA